MRRRKCQLLVPCYCALLIGLMLNMMYLLQFKNLQENAGEAIESGSWAALVRPWTYSRKLQVRA